jgi:putative ABC transport system permease protein
VSEAIARVDPNLPLADVTTGEEIIGRQLRTSRLSALLTSLFATSATFLALTGILGVLSILITQRMREIGLRIALGAGAGSIRSFVVLRGMRPVLVGVPTGLLISLAGFKWLGGDIAALHSPDLLTFLIPSVGLALAGLVACLLPGARAAALDPASLLRSD